MDPETTMRAAGIEPLEPYPGATERLWACRCTTCGRRIDTRLATVLKGQHDLHRIVS